MTGVSDCAQNDPQHLWIWALTALSGILKGHAAFVARFAISRADRAEQEKARAPCSPGRECSIGRFRRPGGRSLTEEPKVRRLCAGGSRIRTDGPARDGPTFRDRLHPPPKVRLAGDSPLEGDGFELPVPERGDSVSSLGLLLNSLPFRPATARLVADGPRLAVGIVGSDADPG